MMTTSRFAYKNQLKNFPKGDSARCFLDDSKTGAIALVTVARYANFFSIVHIFEYFFKQHGEYEMDLLQTDINDRIALDYLLGSYYKMRKDFPIESAHLLVLISKMLKHNSVEASQRVYMLKDSKLILREMCIEGTISYFGDFFIN